MEVEGIKAKIPVNTFMKVKGPERYIVSITLLMSFMWQPTKVSNHSSLH